MSTLMPRWSGRERAAVGVLVTFENARGQTFVLHRAGPSAAALRSACDAAVNLDPTFRVVCICSPQTIYQDLQGRAVANNARGPTVERTPNIPEPVMLGRAGLRDMLHSRLRGKSNATADYRDGPT